MKRTFIALKMPLMKQTIEFVEDVRINLRAEKIKWVEPANMHISLFFLGDTDESSIKNICNSLPEELEGVKPFELICRGLGVFKNVNDAKVLWMGLDRSEPLNLLKLAVDRVVQGEGFAAENRVFNPHLTLGRIKFIKDKAVLGSVLEKYKGREFQKFSVGELVLYESILTPAGPIYKAIKIFRLS